VTSDEREELSRLRRENARLQADVDLLKRATAFMQSRGLCRPGGGVVGKAARGLARLSGGLDPGLHNRGG
jgi:transposase-like protein